ncbi:MAG: ribosomal RNA small subunit methyltransferase A [Bacilli bacterium]|nr:ribosomal RNA small subunit methyltransferase A [Bacilli bacterium]
MINFEFKKSLGQNFINDENIIDKIVKYATVDKDTLVIEVGPGAGVLSKKIIPLSGYTVLYEIDTRLKEILNNTLSGNDNYEIIYNDVLEQNVKEDISKFNYKKIYVVANLPYYITTPIITKLIEEINPDKIVIMIQEEVADRLCATVGSKEYAMITVSLGSKYDIKKLFRVSRNCFTPAPNVDSAVISLDKHDKYDIKDIVFFDKFIKDAFKFKRKNLRNNLKGYDLTRIEDILNKNKYSLSDRAEIIPISLFVDIANSLSK